MSGTHYTLHDESELYSYIYTKIKILKIWKVKTTFNSIILYYSVFYNKHATPRKLQFMRLTLDDFAVDRLENYISYVFIYINITINKA